MDNKIRELEDKIQASRTTHAIYLKEIEDLEKQLEKKGINIDNIEGSIDTIIDRIDKLQRKQKTLFAKINRELKVIEKRV